MSTDVFKGEQKKKKSWSKEMESGGMRKRINVREADNGGYIISLGISGDFPKQNGEGTEWKSIDKEIISKVNPLAGEDKGNPMDEFLSEDIELNEI
jgi:hypothetical protein